MSESESLGSCEIKDIQCTACGIIFNGLQNRIKKVGKRCPECVRKRDTAWRLRRKESGRPVISKKMPREYHRQYESLYFKSEHNRARRNILAKKYREDPELRGRYDARWKVRVALKSGALVKMPCESCGKTQVQAHHDDYNKPIDVRWLCVRCHSEWHTLNTPIYPKEKARGQQ